MEISRAADLCSMTIAERSSQAAYVNVCIKGLIAIFARLGCINLLCLLSSLGQVQAKVALNENINAKTALF